MHKETLAPKKSHWKLKLVFVLFILTVGFVTYGYFWYTKITERDVFSKLLISNNNSYALILKKIAIENERCQQLITKNTGNFADFEYCKQYLVFSDTVTQQEE